RLVEDVPVLHLRREGGDDLLPRLEVVSLRPAGIDALPCGPAPARSDRSGQHRAGQRLSRETRHGPYPPSVWDQAYRRFAVRLVSPVTVVPQLAMLSTFTSLTLQSCLPKRPEVRRGELRFVAVTGQTSS